MDYLGFVGLGILVLLVIHIITLDTPHEEMEEYDAEIDS